MISWREKVRHDRVRPPSQIHMRGDTLVNSWAGPYQGTKLFPAKDWQAYLRVMPHSEYPSYAL